MPTMIIYRFSASANAPLFVFASQVLYRARSAAILVTTFLLASLLRPTHLLPWLDIR
ncbi:MAG: hypothetical protein U1D30_10815 [Planctomycetota bacterium]